MRASVSEASLICKFKMREDNKFMSGKNYISSKFADDTKIEGNADLQGDLDRLD